MASFLDRYQNGEREQVWAEMAALGPQVREEPWFEDAWAVARETMRRARCNVERIIERLDGLGYQFWDGEQGAQGPQGMLMSIGGQIVATPSPLAMAKAALAIDTTRAGPAGRHAAAIQERLAALIGPFQAAQQAADAKRDTRLEAKARITDHRLDPDVLDPPDAGEVAEVLALEAKGMVLPLSVRAGMVEVGDVNFAGAHPPLSAWEGPKFRGVYADPLMVDLRHFHFELESRKQDFDDGENPGAFDAVLAWDPPTKARLTIAKDPLDEGRTLQLPNPCADGFLELGKDRTPFVDYLRRAFACGGFPGWAGRKSRPERELAYLSEGLEPI